MKSFIISIAILVAVASPFKALATDENIPADIAAISDSLKAIYAPDGRVALFKPDFTLEGKNIFLRGETTSREAKSALNSSLSSIGYKVSDFMKILPDDTILDGKEYAVVNLSVCNLRTAPDFSSEMTTQALLGMPMRVLQQDGWWRVQCPDGYIAWVHPVGIYRMNEQQLAEWNKAEKAVVTAHFGMVYSQPDERSQVVSDIVAGDRLILVGSKGRFLEVRFPDDRLGYVLKTNAVSESKWRTNLDNNPQSVIATAFTMMGFPYLWAGTSSKGVDCSGFVRTVLYMHDIIIPRDASQMAYVGERIDIAPDFSNLLPGDLVFFGSKATDKTKERVSHVAIYIGDKRFIHSQGNVHVSSFDPSDALFDEFNLKRLLHAVRFLSLVGKDKSFTTTENNQLYK